MPTGVRVNKKRDYLLLALSLGVIMSVVVLLGSFDPATVHIYPLCPFYAITGWYCPGCGSLRALHQLFNGHIFLAFRLNPLTILLLPFLGYFFLSSSLALAFGRPKRYIFIRPFYIWGLLAAILLFWVLRNIPGEEFSFLRPQITAQPIQISAGK